MNTTIYHVKVTFSTPLLGSQPQLDVASKFIAAKFVDNGGVLPSDEAETLPEKLESSTTVFHKVDGAPILFDYQVKGFIKEAGRIFSGQFSGVDGKPVKALKSKIDNLVFVRPRRICLNLPPGGEITYRERPLRADTAQGPRIALVRSEELPEGTWFECRLEVFDGPLTEDLLRDLFTYGAYKGLGQWRNASWGNFEFEWR